MKYNFTVFDSIITGKLNPLLNKDVPKEHYLQYLRNKFENPYGIYSITLKKKDNSFKLLEKSFETSLHPNSEDVFSLHETLFDQDDNPALAFAIKSAGIQKEAILASHTKFNSDKIFVSIKINYSFDKLSGYEAKYFYYYHLIKIELEDIKTSIKESVFSIRSNEETEQFIHKNQFAIENLTFQLLRDLPAGITKKLYNKQGEYTDEHILNFVLISLENIALFIEQYYFRHLNETACIPYRSRLLNHPELKKKIERVSEHLQRAGIHHDLLKILNSLLVRFMAFNINEKISYKELTYFNLLIDEFHEIFSGSNNVSEDMIIDILVKVNFNSLELFSYRTNKLFSEIDSIEDRNEKINKLHYYLKTFNQNPVKSQTSFNPELPPVNVQLATWLEEEINYLEQNNRLNQLQEASPVYGTIESSKLNSGLSVAQLSFFYKIQSDAGLINHSNKKDIIRFIANNFQTSKVNKISTSSVGSKYYNTESGTKEVVKEFLIKMLNEINRND